MYMNKLVHIHFFCYFVPDQLLWSLADRPSHTPNVAVIHVMSTDVMNLRGEPRTMLLVVDQGALAHRATPRRLPIGHYYYCFCY